MKKKFYSFFLFNVLLCIVTISQAQPGGYKYVRLITIYESQIPDGGSLSNFPYLFKVTNADFRSVANGGHVSGSSGHDILFYQNSCTTPLDHQLEYYDPATGEVVAWIRIPALSTTTDTRIYMYYGNDTVSSSTSVVSTWDAGYSGIWHLTNNPAGTAPQITDATGNAHHGTTYGSMTSAANLVNGKIGKALNFDEVNDYVRIPDFLYGQELTMSFWFNAGEVNGNSYQYLFSHGTWATQNSLNVYVGEDNITIPSEIQNLKELKTVFRDNNDANNFDTLDAGNTMIDGNWHYYTMRIQNTGGAYIYIDGVAVAVYSVWGANTFNPTTDLFLAAREDLNPGRFYGGMLDEVRISSVWRTSNWIRTEYNNQNDPASFSLLGIEGPSLGFCFPLAMNLVDFTAARAGIMVKLKWNLSASDSNENFFIERSDNGNTWNVIGNTHQEYSFTDSAPVNSTLFYRLKYYEGDKIYISSTRKVDAACCDRAIRIYPNPSPDGQFYINFPDAETPEQFMLLDASGALVRQVILEKKYGQTYLLKITDRIRKGIYLLRFRYKDSYQTKMLAL
jgi:hypothetical protein